jgi:RHS repeat-associated protein
MTRLGRLRRPTWCSAVAGTIAAVIASALIAVVPAAAGGTATQLVFTPSPASATGGLAFGVQPEVSFEDSSNAVVTSESAAVTLSLVETNGAILSSCTSLGTNNGVANFSGCLIDLAGTNYQLTASSGGLSGTSSDFNVDVGAVAQAVFSQEPSSIEAGSNFSSAPAVTLEDAGGNVVNTTNYAVGIFTDPSSSPLTCSGTEKAVDQTPSGYAVQTVAGVATFPDCTIATATPSVQLDAVATNISTDVTTTATSSEFSVTTGSASQLAFYTEPTGAEAGFEFLQQPVVAVEDGSGNVVTTATGTISLSITADTGADGASLSCTSQPLVAGLAYFSGCGINLVGDDYTLTATGDDMSSASSAFDVNSTGEGGISFATGPGNGFGGSALLTQPVVSITDQNDSPVSGTVQLSLTGGPAGAALTCTDNPQPAGEGTATFAGCSVNLDGTYQLVATDPDNPAISATSGQFTVSTGAAAQLAFVDEPTGGTGGAAFGVQPVLAIEDAGGNPVSEPGVEASLSIVPGTGTAGAQLTCSATPAAISSVTDTAVFSGCDIDKVGVGYQLAASADGFVATSDPFTITTGTAARLIFVNQPNGGVVNSPFGTQPTVAVADLGGNPIGPATNDVTLAISTGNLTCVSNPAATEPSTGVATFVNCAASALGTGETLTATSPELALATSSGFNVTAGTALGEAPNSIPLAQTFGGTTYSRNPTSTVDDVNSATGALELSDSDLTVAGIGEPFALTRTYNSLDTTGGAFGPGWTSLLDAGVTIAPNAKTATVRGADGQQVVFTASGGGTWVGPPGARETLACASQTCTVTLFSGDKFQSIGGRIQNFLNGDGQGLHFVYVGTTLTEVLVQDSTATIVVHVTENGAGEVTAITTPTRSVHYTYVGGLLATYEDPDGNVWSYSYGPNGITDVNSPVGLALVVYYSGTTGRVCRAESLVAPTLFDNTYTWNAGEGLSTRWATVASATGLVQAPYQDLYTGNVLVGQENPDGDLTAYDYDGQLDIIEVQNPLDERQLMTYDTMGDVTSQSMPYTSSTFAVTTFAYNAKHELTSETDPNGNTTTYAYSGANLIRTTAPGPGPGVNTTTYDYNAYGERTETIGPLGIVKFSYDGAGNQTGFVEATLSGVSLNGLGPWTTFNEGGAKVTETDARGHLSSGINPAYETVNVYDAVGNLLATTAPGPQSTTTTYNGDDTVASTTSAAGVVTDFAWDASDLTESATTNGATADTVYDPSGYVLANQQGESLGYDLAGNETSLTASTGVTTSYSYDAAGNAVRSSDTAGHSASYLYGPNGQLASSTVNGVTTSYSYDHDGNTLTETDNAGHTTGYAYNSQELASSVTNAAGTTHYVYDDDGNLIQMVDGDGHITYYTYNAANERTAMIVNGNTWSYRYDVAGNLLSTTDPMDRTTTYVLNAEDQSTSTTYTEPGQTTIADTATYNATGERTSMTDPVTGLHTYTYDADGNLTEMDNGPSDTFTYDYTTPGQMTEAYPDGAQVVYTYDDEDNVMSVSSGSISVSYLRNSARQITGEVYSDGLVQTQGYNTAGEPTSQSLTCAGTVVLYSATSYNADGNPLATSTSDGQSDVTESYGYSSTSAVSAQQSASTPASPSWDPGAACTSGTESTAGNPNGGDSSDTSSDTGAPTTANEPAGYEGIAPTVGTSANPITYDAVGNQLTNAGTTSTYNTSNELVSEAGVKTAHFTYDASGDLISATTSAGTTLYGYNAANELVAVTSPTSTTDYTYDGDGNRVTRTVTGAGACSERYLWDVDGQVPLLAEETTTGFAMVRQYFYGAGPVAVQTPSSTDYLFTSANGDVTAIANQAGSLQETISYDAYGNATVTPIDEATPMTEPLLFESQYQDPTTGLYDLRARNYDPTTGRFTQRDAEIAPIGTPVTSPYIYADDEPTTLADPTGLSVNSALDSAFYGHSTESASIVADAKYGVVAIQALRGGVMKAMAYVAKTEEAAASAENAVADAAPEVEEVLADSAPEIEEIGTEEGAAATDIAGKALGVIGIGLGAYVTYADCNSYAHGSGSLSMCVGDAVGLAITTVCLVATEGIGSVLCGLAGAALAVVISQFGPQIVEGLTDLGDYAIEGAKIAYKAVAQAFTEAGAALASTYNAIAAQVTQGITTALNWTENAVASAIGTIKTGFDKLASAISSGFTSALNTLEQAGYTAEQMAETLKDQFNEGVKDMAELLNQLEYGASAVLGAIKNVYNEVALEASKLLVSLDYTINQVASAIKSAFSYIDRGVAEVLEELNQTVDTIANALKFAFTDPAAAVADVLNDLNYSINQIATALHDVFTELDSALVGILIGINATLSQVATALSKVYTEGVQYITTLFAGLSYTATEVATAIKGAFEAIYSAVAGFLQAAGYALDDIAAALQSVFSDAAQAVSQILKDIGYTASEIESWLSNVLGEAVSDIESLLSDIGFSSSVIDAIGSAFASFGQAVVSGLESLGDDIASLF